MPCVVELLRSRLWPRAATLALITIGLAACSGVSSRFNESSPEVTGALQPGQVAPVGQVDGQALLPRNASLASLAPKPAPMAAMSRAGSKPVPAAASKKPETGLMYTPVSPPEPAPDRDHSKPSDEGTGTFSKIRWPATGRVIASFGSTINGQSNAGINIALPENTPVKAAEDGIVSYAGNELTAYGNLVQVRHPNGYFTIYAHAKELLVKRGDPVKRGQPIARSGQTGNVNTPQLHFEVRKGAAPLDPMKFLNGA